MSYGWSREKRLTFEQAFYDFLGNCWVNSKDFGPICLGERLYNAQKRFFTAIFDGLEADKHEFYCLKARQLGITTGTRALTTFYAGVHQGLKGALVFDTQQNRDEARAELELMIDDLPSQLGFPRIVGRNRDALALKNSSKVLFKAAGVSKRKTSAGLGRSVGLTFAHLSELCSYDNDSGLIAFKESLSDVHPDRLYIYESTARGFNNWFDMWEAAKEDEAHCVTIFIGWWAKDTNVIKRDHPDFQLYGLIPPTQKEIAKIREVKHRYGHDISPEQLAWIRRKMDPNFSVEGDAEPDVEEDGERLQEQAWTEDDAFQQTGSIFFPPENLTEMTVKSVSHKFKTYSYATGLEFVDTKVFSPAFNKKSIELKVWEEPVNDAVYIIAADSAYGSSETSDRSAAQVFRAFADGFDQVAEYNWPLVNTRQFAWVLASLLGWYGMEGNQVFFILEINGSGEAVWAEFRSLKKQVESHLYMAKELEARGLQKIFTNVRNYLYSRSDATTVGSNNYHFKTKTQLKVLIMERLRDFVTNKMFQPRSEKLVTQMRTITREGDSIKAQGSLKDDLVVSAALGCHYWETKVRQLLISQRRTRAAEDAKHRHSLTDKVFLLNQAQLQTFFDVKRAGRDEARRQAVRMGWRYGRRS
jgi:hypothetical protein